MQFKMKFAVRRTGAEIIWESLVCKGVKYVFGYPGGAILPAYDALAKYNIHHVLVRHEQGAAHAAYGYARASGEVGVVIATLEPGDTNLVTGIATAMMDSSPIVCITGQLPAKVIGFDAFQEADITAIMLPITKQTFLITRAEKIAETIAQAFHIARSGRPGPVLVDITKDAQQSVCEFCSTSLFANEKFLCPDRSPTSAEYDEAQSLIRNASRPVILAGHGIIQSGAAEAVRALAERADIPVAVTLRGIGGFPASHSLNLGMMGMHGEEWVNHDIQEADLLLALGMRFDDRVTGNLETYSPNAKKIHVEIGPAEINKNVKVDTVLIGDVGDVVQKLLFGLEALDHGEWHTYLDELRGSAAVHDIQNLADNGHLYAAHVIHDLWRETNGEAIVVADVGQHQMWKAQYYPHENPRSLITSGSLRTMGFALPAAIGAKLAKPEAEVWVVTGDVGFQLIMAELATLAQEKLDIKIAVINNGCLGMMRQGQHFFYESRCFSTPLLSPNFVKLAEAYGIMAVSVTKRAEVLPVIQTARARSGPMLLDFQVEQEDSAPGCAA